MTQNNANHDIINDLKNLRSASAEQQSIDTYAKMLWLKNDFENLKKTKHLIVLFFEIFEYLKKLGEPSFLWNTLPDKQPFDNRYDAFLAGILNQGTDGRVKFPQNINVLSWNYDYEFEKAVLKYTNDEYIESCCSRPDFNIIFKNKLYNNTFDNIAKNMRLVKINGFIGLWRIVPDNNNNNYNNYPALGYNSAIIRYKKDEYTTENIIKFYKENIKKKEFDPAISYSWEEDNNNNNALSHAKDIMAKTDILVVIGYSFPYFNREIDRQLLSSDNSKQLSKIYIQDPQAADIKETIQGFRDDWDYINPTTGNILYKFPFQLITNSNQFYMPHEL